MSKDSVYQTLIGVMTICVTVTTGLVLRRELAPPRSVVQNDALRVGRIDNWREFATGQNRLGPATAAVTIVEFSDFQCPFCARLAAEITQLRAKYPADVQVIYRHFPLTALHPFAYAAALASECAAEQQRFVEYHDLLFTRQALINDSTIRVWAANAGVPQSRAFAACLESDGAARRVQADIDAGNELGVTGTPTVLVGPRRLYGTPTFVQLDSLVQLSLKRAD